MKKIIDVTVCLALTACAVAVAGERDQRDVIRRCMTGRGYNVLQ